MPAVKKVDLEPVRINVSATEKIGLPQYSSVTISASLSRSVPDGDDDYLKTELLKVASIVEEFVAEERQTVLNSVQSSQNVGT